MSKKINVNSGEITITGVPSKIKAEAAAAAAEDMENLSGYIKRLVVKDLKLRRAEEEMHKKVG